MSAEETRDFKTTSDGMEHTKYIYIQCIYIYIYIHKLLQNRMNVYGDTDGGDGVCISGGGGHVLSPHQLASELGRQRRLYDDLLDKTQQIQSVR